MSAPPERSAKSWASSRTPTRGSGCWGPGWSLLLWLPILFCAIYSGLRSISRRVRKVLSWIYGGVDRRICSRRSRKTLCPLMIFSRASSSVNHAARSTSGTRMSRPLFVGHSTSQDTLSIRVAEEAMTCGRSALRPGDIGRQPRLFAGLNILALEVAATATTSMVSTPRISRAGSAVSFSRPMSTT